MRGDSSQVWRSVGDLGTVLKYEEVRVISGKFSSMEDLTGKH